MDNLSPAPSYPSNVSQNEANQTDDICVFDEEFKFFLLPVSYSVVFILGLPLNLTAIWIFFAQMRPWSPTTVYMFNLGLSDTLYLLSLPTLIHYYAHRNNWPFGEPLCKIVRFLFYTNLYCSILFLTCISVHRYMGVCHPLFTLQRMKTRYAHMLCVGVWLSVSACLVPNLIFVTVSPRGNDTLCHDTTHPEEFENYVEYSTAVMSLLFGAPCLVIAVCYGLMARELMKPIESGSRRTLPSYKKRSIKTIAVVLTVFVICFLPFHITRTMYYYFRLLDADCQLLNVINLVYKITRPLASANSCFDPVLYFLASDNYQRKLAAALRKFLCLRRLPTCQSGLLPPKKQNGLAVISNKDTEKYGSLGNLLVIKEEDGQVADTEEGESVQKIRNNHRDKESIEMPWIKKQRDDIGKVIERRTYAVLSTAGNNQSDHRKDGSKCIESTHIIQCPDINIETDWKKTEGKSERKKSGGECKGHRNLKGRRHLREPNGEVESRSCWNLLDSVHQEAQCVCANPIEDIDGERTRYSLPTM